MMHSDAGSEVSMGEVVCAWCGRQLGIAALSLDATARSHGICLDCERVLTEALNALFVAPAAKDQNSGS
jgi:hypothetical protein